MQYVDGCVLAVPTQNRAEYLKHAKVAAQVFKDHGAVSVTECWGEDVPDGELTSFPMAVKCEADETVVLSWIVWPSKQAREVGMQAVMVDERMDPANTPVPFDGKRMIFGGFELLYSA